MIELNKCKLVPGITSNWGDILGDITKQQDLVDYVAEHGGGDVVWGSITGDINDQEDLAELLNSYALKTWVEGQGYLLPADLAGYATETWVGNQGYLVQDDLSQYATRQWVTGRGYITSDALAGYATETWVGQQGYITSSALSGYATETWVGQQGYINEIKTVNNQSLVGEGNIEITGLTPEQEDAIDPLVNRDGEGYLHYVPYEEKIPADTIIGYNLGEVYTNANRRVFNIGGEVYYINRNDNSIYIYDRNSWGFVYHVATTGYAEIGNLDYILWEDSQGRVYYYNQYKVDLDTGVFTPWDMGGDYVQYDGTHNSNLIQKDGVTYLISQANSCAYIFNEGNQLFDSSIPITGTFPNTGANFARYLTEFDGHWLYDDVTNQVELVFHLDDPNPYIELVNLEVELFPHNWDYTDPNTGTVYAENTRAVFVHPVTINGQTDYYVMGYPQQVMFKLVDGAWVAVEDFNIISNYASNTAGAYAGDLWFGYGYIRTPSTYGRKMLIWNFGDTKGVPALYRFDNEIQYRVENLENAGFATTARVQLMIDQVSPPVPQAFGNYVLGATRDDGDPGVSYHWDSGDLMKLVEREGIDLPVVDRPNDFDSQDSYGSAGYILTMNEYYDTTEEDSEEIRTKYVNYIACEDERICRRELIYNEVDGDWELQNEIEYDPAWIGGGWEFAQIHNLIDDPYYYDRLGDFPVQTYFDIGWDKLPFGQLSDNGDSLSFSGFCWDQGIERLGLYRVDWVEEDSEGNPGVFTYWETFVPFMTEDDVPFNASRIAPDTSVDGTYVLKATVLDGEITYEWVLEGTIIS